ncbi:MAG: SDR family NAD(P)-dependent oxidoreductase [Pseudomonadota bacterium]
MKALVTGGTSGLGRAFCDALKVRGFEVTSLDITTPETGCGFDHIPCDLASSHNVDFALKQLVKRGPFDVVIFNAGISATGKFEEIDADAHARVLAINSEAPIVLCAGLMAENMISEGGHIGFVSSLSHYAGYPGAASYAASKDALAIYAKSIRKPFAKSRSISVTCAFPGPLRTAHAERHAPKGADASKRMTPVAAAKIILADIMAGKSKSLPGGAAKATAVLGRVAPASMTKLMRKIIYDKLEKTVAD